MNLKEFRDFKGFQRKFAVAGVGISSKHLNDIEAGKVNLTDNCATKLSNFYGLDINSIKNMYMEGKMRQVEIQKKQAQLLKQIDFLSNKSNKNKKKNKYFR